MRRRRSSTSADAESYRAQIAYLLERSPFYRDKLGSSPSDRLEDIAGLPAFAAPLGEPWLYDGRVVLRARPRSR